MTSTYRLKRLKRERKIYDERQKLLAVPDAMATAVDKKLMKKYGVSRTTIWRIANTAKPTTQAHERSTNQRGIS